MRRNSLAVPRTFAGWAVFVLAAGCSRPAARAEPAPIASALAPVAISRSAPQVEPAPPDVARPPADAVMSSSGVASKSLRAGQGGDSPKVNDCVRARYTSWKRDGSLHATNTADAEPATQCLRRMMPGLAEVVEQMSVGEARRVWVPGSLTYRSKDADEPAPSDDLTFDVTLLELLKSPEIPPDLAVPPLNAQRTRSGLRLRVLTKGTGPRQARPNDHMTVRFTGWTSAGVLFESTELGGDHPTLVTRADVVRGLGEGLSLMQIGERARVWIPAALAFGDKPRRGAPAGNLVYDLELVAVQ